MCRRSGGSVSVTLILFFLFSTNAARSQEALPERVAALLEQFSEQGADVESLSQYYEALLRRPINLNAASRLQLEELGLMTLFQTESLLAWRERCGGIYSATELSLVEGFTPETVGMLRPFIDFGPPSAAKGLSQTYTARFKKKWKQEGFSITSKAQLESAQFSASAVLDNDPKERFPDFLSASVQYRGLYAGDFTARFGQGLVLWKAFPLSAFGTPASVARRGGGLQAYRSTDESNFFRGVGYTRDAGPLSMTAFVSYNALDARVVDGRYTSIATDGLHATEAERAKRHAMHEFVAGTHVSLTRGFWRFGLTGAAYHYDKANGRRVQDYNRYQQYDGWWGNIGIDAYGSLGSLRLFGEAAVDAHLAPAVNLGGVWSPSYGFETSLALRCYSPSYIATHAGAWSSISSVSNQIGALYALQWVRGAWTLQLHADYAWHPWKRYRMEAGTSSFKGRVQLSRSFPGGAELESALSWSGRLKARIRLTLPLDERWTVALRADANRGGIGGYADLRWRPSGQWDFSGRLTVWQTADWDSRLFFYERGVPQSFPVETYSGKGVGAYLTARYAPTRNVEMWVKLQQGYCAYFVRIFIPG